MYIQQCLTGMLELACIENVCACIPALNSISQDISHSGNIYIIKLAGGKVGFLHPGPAVLYQNIDTLKVALMKQG